MLDKILYFSILVNWYAESANANVTCPDELHSVLLPHPTNCSKFYICSNGIPHTRECQYGLHFNPAIKICDWPNNAGCDAEDEQEMTTAGATLLPEPIINCTSELTGKLLPSPDNCKDFYVCSQNEAIAKACPEGLHFNPNLQLCDWPESAGCYINKTVPLNSDTDTAIVCKENDENGDILFEDPTDCGKLYVCVAGSPVSMSCPGELHFNSLTKICDFPEYAGCDVHNAAATTEKITTLKADAVDLCEIAKNDNKHLISDKKNCNKFFSCVNGVQVSMPCPAGLHFSYEKQNCDWPSIVKCKPYLFKRH